MIEQISAQRSEAVGSVIATEELPERLFIVRPANRRLFRIWGEKGGYEWNDLDDERGTWFVVLGQETTDEKCLRLAKRFGLGARDLIAMRDDPDWFEREIQNWGPLQ